MRNRLTSEQKLVYEILNKLTIIHRFRNRIYPMSEYYDEKTLEYYTDMCDAIDDLLNYAQSFRGEKNE